ncbi:aminotransferase family protein-like protein [Xylariomycetidae sp. FL2044]|nr:aminotransferase family protein-like protein [Xylariomycetidae sp. FL2044]
MNSPGHDDTASAATTRTPYGRPMRLVHFNFAPSYRPLNHGSFGTYPSVVRDYQRKLQAECEARPDTFLRFAYPKLLQQAREAVAPLLGADADETVFVPNALTGINTVLRNVTYEEGDVIIYFSTVYGGCLSTIQSLEETSPVQGFGIDLTYPLEDDEISERFCTAVLLLHLQGKRVKLAIFDTVTSFPGVRFPWERLVQVCKDRGILSLVDGAHGVGHIDLSHTAQVGPDFLITNCYKWLMVPRGCTLLFVPYRNQASIKTTYPTAEGYKPEPGRKSVSTTEYFVSLFSKVSTIDVTPYMCVLKAREFRDQVCGGEDEVRDYCKAIAREGGELLAAKFGTEVLENQAGSLRDCCFTNVRLPLEVDAGSRTPDADGDGRNICRVPVGEAKAAADWITERSVNEFDSFIATRFYAGSFWIRLSGQIYVDIADFEWAGNVLLDLCSRVKDGRWKSPKMPSTM